MSDVNNEAIVDAVETPVVTDSELAEAADVLSGGNKVVAYAYDHPMATLAVTSAVSAVTGIVVFCAVKKISKKLKNKKACGKGSVPVDNPEN